MSVSNRGRRETVNPAGQPSVRETDRRRSWRSGRRRGVSIYIPGTLLQRLGFSPDEPAPSYTLTRTRLGRLVVNLFRDDAS